MDKDEKIKFLKKELDENSISLKKFLLIYYGMCDLELYNKPIKHQDIKKLFPYIKRVSFESLLLDKNLLYSGDIIAVKDSCGNVAPYINPKLNDLENIPNIEYSSDYIDPNDERIKKILMNEDLTKHELYMLSKLLKRGKRKKELRDIQKRLNTNKLNKQKVKKKGFDENDEY